MSDKELQDLKDLLDKGIISQELSRVIDVEYQVHHPNSGFWKRKNINLGIKKIVHLQLTEIAWN